MEKSNFVIDPGYNEVLSNEPIVLLPAVIKVAIKKHRTKERTNMLQIEPLKTFTKSFVFLIFWSVRKTMFDLSI